MTESKYGHLFVKDARSADEDYADANGENTKLPNVGPGLALAGVREYADSKVFSTAAILTPSDERTLWVPPHEHHYDELISWIGTNPDDPWDLGAELFMTIEGEEHIITKTGSVYVPAGTEHCPLGWNWIKRPFVFTITFMSDRYQTDEHERKRAAGA